MAFQLVVASLLDADFLIGNLDNHLATLLHLHLRLSLPHGALSPKKLQQSRKILLNKTNRLQEAYFLTGWATGSV